MPNFYVLVSSKTHQNPKLNDIFHMFRGELTYKLMTVSQGLFRCLQNSFQRTSGSGLFLLTGCALHCARKPMCML